MTSTEYTFDPRLASAKTIPSSWYTDADLLQTEKSKVFARSWQLVGSLNGLKSAGDYLTAYVADEPVLVVRDFDERLRAFSNVCRHRAGPVAEGAGNRKNFRCGYHGWTYTLAGRLRSTPEFEDVECFRTEENNLPEFSVETWAGLVFVNLDAETPPLADCLADLPERVSHRTLAVMKPAARKDWHIECNWKVYVDNYLEGYHIPIVHPELNRELDYKNYFTETKRFYSIQHSPIKRVKGSRLTGSSFKDLREEAPAGNDALAEAQYFWIFPNLMLNVYPDNFSTNLIIPLGPERTLTVFEWYQFEPETEAARREMERIVGFSDEVQIEDIKICEAVQRGLRSRTYNQGRFSVKRENGVHHFHGLLCEFLAK